MAGIVGTQKLNWQQLKPSAVFGQVITDSTLLRKEREVNSIFSVTSEENKSSTIGNAEYFECSHLLL